ncbi:hypothetical protein AVEN_195446-1 [Araneus ventricosus]|uniref:Uncharacterized protein n=1 Tax=Araneus ventricosus TaxID=182803 RepID=A0A4Y2I295_ARAVE|nr:hypothetical protein AVEN_195446-1 [Araneus ventricosus]
MALIALKRKTLVMAVHSIDSFPKSLKRNKSLEERVFHMVLNSITADWGKAYCHLFLVAFNESIFEDRRFEKIVPKNIVGAYYTIPNDLISLCMKIGFSSSREELLMYLHHY